MTSEKYQIKVKHIRTSICQDAIKKGKLLRGSSTFARTIESLGWSASLPGLAIAVFRTTTDLEEGISVDFDVRERILKENHLPEETVRILK